MRDKRREIWLAASGAAQKGRSINPAAPILPAARWPQIVEIELTSRDEALLWVIDNQWQTGTLPSHQAPRKESRRPARLASDRLTRLPTTDVLHASSTITTFPAPTGWTSETFVEACRREGFLIGGQSGYLAERRLVQIATMGAITREECAAFLQYLESGSNRAES